MDDGLNTDFVPYLYLLKITHLVQWKNCLTFKADTTAEKNPPYLQSFDKCIM